MSGTNYYTLIDTDVYAYEIDDEGRVLRGKFNTLATPPTTANTFEKGCEMTKTDAGNGIGAVYQNTGTFAVPAWTLMPLTGGSGSPSAPFNSIQFNNAGNFGGTSVMTWNDVSQTLNITGSLNQTQFILNDTGQEILAEVVAGVGDAYSLIVDNTHVAIGHVFGGVGWGFEVTNDNGGETHIAANNTAWVWPNSDGLGNQVLTTNGAGVLGWQSIGGGTIIGGGALGQATYWTGGTVIAGSNDYLWSNGSKIFQVGDITSTQNDTTFVVNDTAQFIKVQANDFSVTSTTSAGVITANTVTRTVNLGDISSVGNDIKLEVNDTNQIIRNYGPTQVNSALNNLDRSLLVNPSTRVVTSGDINGFGNNTVFSVDDTAETITGIAQTAGVGSVFGCEATQSYLAYQSGANSWGFGASNAGGGQTTISAGATDYIWPGAVGAAGSVLTDAAGNGTLSWSVPGVPALTNTHIFVGNAGNVATDVAMSGDTTISNTGVVTITPDTIYTFGIKLTSVRYPNVQGQNLALGDTDLYTVPVGKKALVCPNGRVNNVTGGNILFSVQMKIGATYYRIGSDSNIGAGAGSNGVALGGYVVLNAGEILAVNTATTAGLNIVLSVIEYDAACPLSSTKFPALANGDNTIMTVPANRNYVGVNFQSDSVSSGMQVNIANDSGGSRDYIMYRVPSGDLPTSDNQMYPATASSDNTVRFESILGGLTTGDYIVVNTNAGTADQSAWITYVEIPV